MSWGYCGIDSMGRPIGYLFASTCDHPGCSAEINRGLSYVCGMMHGEDEVSCEKYFCEAHKLNYIEADGYDNLVRICDACAKAAVDSGAYVEDEDEGILRPISERGEVDG